MGILMSIAPIMPAPLNRYHYMDVTSNSPAAITHRSRRTSRSISSLRSPDDGAATRMNFPVSHRTGSCHGMAMWPWPVFRPAGSVHRRVWLLTGGLAIFKSVRQKDPCTVMLPGDGLAIGEALASMYSGTEVAVPGVLVEFKVIGARPGHILAQGTGKNIEHRRVSGTL
jgi:hypothetical protein